MLQILTTSPIIKKIKKIRMLGIGDLIRIKPDFHSYEGSCYCFLCSHQMKDAMGVVTNVWIDEDDEQSSIVEFPCGETVFRYYEYESIEIVSRVNNE